MSEDVTLVYTSTGGRVRTPTPAVYAKPAPPRVIRRPARAGEGLRPAFRPLELVSRPATTPRQTEPVGVVDRAGLAQRLRSSRGHGAYLSQDEAAQLLGMTPQAVDRAQRAGRLPTSTLIDEPGATPRRCLSLVHLASWLGIDTSTGTRTSR
jgi:hypothetical protein